jgi:hypothetical protein
MVNQKLKILSKNSKLQIGLKNDDLDRDGKLVFDDIESLRNKLNEKDLQDAKQMESSIEN